MTYGFGDYTLDTFREELRKNGDLVPLEPKSYRMLSYFVTSGGRLVNKEELLTHVWPGVNVDDSAVRRSIRNIRRALGESRFEQGIIETQHGRGYRFLPPVIVTDSKPQLKDAEASENPVAAAEPVGGSKEPSASLLETAILLSQSHQKQARRPAYITEGESIRSEVFLDASFGVALAIRSHPKHRVVQELAESYRRRNVLFVTTRSILLDLIAQVSEILGSEAGFELLDAAEDDENLEIVPISDELYAKAKRFAVRYGPTNPHLDFVAEFVIRQRDLERALPRSISHLETGFKKFMGVTIGITCCALIGIVTLLSSLVPNFSEPNFSRNRLWIIGGSTLAGCIVGALYNMLRRRSNSVDWRGAEPGPTVIAYIAGFLATQILIYVFLFIAYRY